MRFGRSLIDPEHLVTESGIREGMCVADLGCGRTGHAALSAARRVGAEGKVYAVDLVKEHLRMLEGICAMNGLCNLNPVWGDYERTGGTRIPAKALDVAFLVNNLATLRSPEGMSQEVRRILKPDGKLVIIDWKKDFPHPVKPKTDKLFNLRDAELLFTRLGFKKIDEVPVSQTHWGLVFAS